MRKRVLCLASFILLLGASTVCASPELIEPGTEWYDTSLNQLAAQGAGVIKVGDTYYLVGMYTDSDPCNRIIIEGGAHTMPLFVGITCYSSTDFANWTFENWLLTAQPSGDLVRENWVGRPKIIYNDTTEQYVMYMNVGRDAGVATCSTVNGNYTYQGSYMPLGETLGDLTVFKDDDGKAYLIGVGMKIYELSSDYLSVVGLTKDLNARKTEAPAMFKAGGVYYLLCSGATWYTSNDNVYYTATSLSGKWSKAADFTPGSSNTWDSQTTFVQAIEGTSTTTYVYLGDRWDEWDYGNSTYIWLPLTVNGTTLTMDWYDQWTIDTETGEWAPVGGPPQYIFSDGFESGDFTAGGWTTSGSTAQINATPYTGLYSAKLCKVAWIEKAVSTVGYTDIHLEYVFRTMHLDDPDEGFTVEWYDGSNWNPVETLVSAVDWEIRDWLLPAGADNNPDFRIRFSNAGGRMVDCTYLDDVVVDGTEQ